MANMFEVTQGMTPSEANVGCLLAGTDCRTPGKSVAGDWSREQVSVVLLQYFAAAFDRMG